MKKEKTINLAARMMAEKRWAGMTAEQRTENNRRVAQTPRTAKRCFCGATGMITAAERYFDCCRRAGVITMNLELGRKLRKEQPPEEVQPEQPKEVA